jgi:hypothetical protein
MNRIYHETREGLPDPAIALASSAIKSAKIIL